MRGFLHKHYSVVVAVFFIFFAAGALGAQTYRINTSPTVTDCSGFFVDSGGATGNYGPNENFTSTICADGSTGSHIRLLVDQFDLGAGDNITFYDGPTATPGTEFDPGFAIGGVPFIIQARAANASGCITVVFTSDATGQGAGFRMNISCVVRCQGIISELVSSTPAVAPVDTGYIDICPGQSVNFLGRGIYPENGVVYQHSDATSIFEWDFGDGSDPVRSIEANHVYTRPGGYYVQLTITDQRGCTNTNFLKQRVRVAPPAEFVFEPVEDVLCLGDTISVRSAIDTSGVFDLGSYPVPDGFGGGLGRSDTLFLPDGSGGSYEESVTFTQFRPGATLTDPNDLIGITLSLEHSYSGDLDIELICPDGTSVFLHQFPSGTGSTNFGFPYATSPVDGESQDRTPGIPLMYTFNNTAAQTLRQFDPTAPNINYTTVPSDIDGDTHTYSDTYFPEGEYLPQQPFSTLVGCPLNGEWTVRVTDNLGADNGWLFSWEIEFAPYLIPDFESFTAPLVSYGWEPSNSDITVSPDSLYAAPQGAGNVTYNFFVVDAFGCRTDTLLNFQVLPPVHPDCYECTQLIPEGRDTAICVGQSVLLDVSSPVDAQCVTFETNPRARIGALNHPLGTPYESRIEVNSIAQNTLTNPQAQICAICINYETPFPDDMFFTLQAPNGANLLLASRNGGITPNAYIGTCFTPTATQNINNATAPFNGEYLPEGNWNVLNNAPINGTWRLLVSDRLGQEYGELTSWSISFLSTNNVTYNWSPAAGLTCNNCPTPTASPTSSRAYNITARDSYGCSQTEIFNVNVIANAQAPNVTCTSTADAVTFTWMPMPGVTEYEYNITVDGMPGGWVTDYTQTSVTIEDLINGADVSIEVRAYFGGTNFNCVVPSATSSCTVNFCGLLMGNAAIEPVSCFGLSDGEVTLEALAGNAPFQVTLSNNNTYDGLTLTGLAAGDYTFELSDAGGCIVDGAFTVGTPDSLFVNAAQTVQSCNGLNQSQAMATPGGGTGGFSYRWNDPAAQTTATATNLAPGTWQVTATDNTGCATTTSVTVEQLEPVAFTLEATDPTCQGDQDGQIVVMNVSGGLGTTPTDYNYNWQGGATGSTRNNLAGGATYRVSVTDAQGCVATQEIALQDPVAVEFAVTGEAPSCFDTTDGTATALNISGPHNGPYTYQWNAAANNQTGATATNLAAGTFSVIVRDEMGCEAINQVTLIQPLAITAEFSVRDNPCFGDALGAINAQVDGGVPGYQLEWSNGSLGGNISNLVAGDYTLSVTDNNGCELTQTVRVTEPGAIQAGAATEDISCFGLRDGSITVNMLGGTPPYRYSLNNETFRNSNMFIGQLAGNYTIYVVDAQGCRTTTQTAIVEPGPFSVDAGQDLTIIYGDSIALSAVTQNAQGNVEFIWDAPYAGTLSCDKCPSPFASPDATIDYEVYAVDENGCGGTDIVRVIVEKPKLVVVPTGFSPNGDNRNDLLLVHGRPGTQILLFQIYDRWGELIYEDRDFAVNDATRGWDGTFKGKYMNPGVYVWAIVALHEDGTEEPFRGQTTIIR